MIVIVQFSGGQACTVCRDLVEAQAIVESETAGAKWWVVIDDDGEELAWSYDPHNPPAAGD